MPLVEVIGTQWTSPAAIDFTMKLHADAGKTPAHVKKDVPGFIGNRLQHALWREAISLVEHGICDAETVDTVIKAAFGRRLAVLGPLENADLVGTDLTLAIHQTVLPDIDSRPGPSPYLERLVAEGKLGFKTGEGFRTWIAGAAGGAARQGACSISRRRATTTVRSDDDLHPRRIATCVSKDVRERIFETRRDASGESKSRHSARHRRRRRRRCARDAARSAPGQAVIKIGHVSPRPARSPASARPIRSSSIRCKGILAKGLQSGGKTYQGRDHLQGQPVERQPRRRGRLRADPVATRSISWWPPARPTPPIRSPTRPRSTRCPASPPTARGSPISSAARAIPAKGFTWTYHFFWGLEDVIAAFLALWDGAPTNKVSAACSPTTPTAMPGATQELGLPPALAAAGYKLVDPGRYQPMNNDFSVADRRLQGGRRRDRHRQ